MKGFEFTHWVIKKQTADLTDADTLLQPPFKGNCLNWVLGHILFSRGLVLKTLGATLDVPADTLERYKRESDPVTDDEPGVLSLADLLKGLERAQEQIIARLQSISEEELAAEVNEKIVGERVAVLHWHETYHTGQLELLRQLAGKNDKVI